VHFADKNNTRKSNETKSSTNHHIPITRTSNKFHTTKSNPESIKKLLKNYQTSIGIPNLESGNNENKHKLYSALPKYKVDLAPLNYNVMFDERLKLLRNNNDFLFKETPEEKELKDKIRKLTIESTNTEIHIYQNKM